MQGNNKNIIVIEPGKMSMVDFMAELATHHNAGAIIVIDDTKDVSMARLIHMREVCIVEDINAGKVETKVMRENIPIRNYNPVIKFEGVGISGKQSRRKRRANERKRK